MIAAFRTPLCIVVAVAVFGLARTAPAQHAAGAAPHEPAPAARPAGHDLLDRVLPDITLEAVAFSDAIAFLRDATQANIFVDWRALEAAGIEKSVPISLQLKNARFGAVLDLVLRSASADPPLGVEMKDGILVIGVRQDAPAPAVPPGAGFPGMPGGPMQPQPENLATRTYDVLDLAPDPDRMAELADVLREVAGITARNPVVVRGFGGKLIVVGDDRTHDQVHLLLGMLRERPAGHR